MRFLVYSFFVTAVLLESTLWFLYWRADPGDYDLYAKTVIDFHEFRYLRWFDGSPELSVFFESHPTRGWTLKKNKKTQYEGHSYTTNNVGHRSLKNYVTRPTAFKVLVIGDSFSFGSDADDSSIWPTQLEKLSAKLQVINLAVGGYGIDQMWITLDEEFDTYKPDLVIFAIYGDDFHRTRLDFFDFRKPYFSIVDKSLVRHGTPIANLSDVRKYCLGPRKVHG